MSTTRFSQEISQKASAATQPMATFVETPEEKSKALLLEHILYSLDFLRRSFLVQHQEVIERLFRDMFRYSTHDETFTVRSSIVRYVEQLNRDYEANVSDPAHTISPLYVVAHGEQNLLSNQNNLFARQEIFLNPSVYNDMNRMQYLTLVAVRTLQVAFARIQDPDADISAFALPTNLIQQNEGFLDQKTNLETLQKAFDELVLDDVKQQIRDFMAEHPNARLNSTPVVPTNGDQALTHPLLFAALHFFRAATREANSLFASQVYVDLLAHVYQPLSITPELHLHLPVPQELAETYIKSFTYFVYGSTALEGSEFILQTLRTQTPGTDSRYTELAKQVAAISEAVDAIQTEIAAYQAEQATLQAELGKVSRAETNFRQNVLTNPDIADKLLADLANIYSLEQAEWLGLANPAEKLKNVKEQLSNKVNDLRTAVTGKESEKAAIEHQKTSLEKIMEKWERNIVYSAKLIGFTAENLNDLLSDRDSLDVLVGRAKRYQRGLTQYFTIIDRSTFSPFDIVEYTQPFEHTFETKKTNNSSSKYTMKLTHGPSNPQITTNGDFHPTILAAQTAIALIQMHAQGESVDSLTRQLQQYTPNEKATTQTTADLSDIAKQTRFTHELVRQFPPKVIKQLKSQFLALVNYETTLATERSGLEKVTKRARNKEPALATVLETGDSESEENNTLSQTELVIKQMKAAISTTEKHIETCREEINTSLKSAQHMTIHCMTLLIRMVQDIKQHGYPTTDYIQMLLAEVEVIKTHFLDSGKDSFFPEEKKSVLSGGGERTMTTMFKRLGFDSSKKVQELLLPEDSVVGKIVSALRHVNDASAAKRLIALVITETKDLSQLHIPYDASSTLALPSHWKPNTKGITPVQQETGAAYRRLESATEAANTAGNIAEQMKNPESELSKATTAQNVAFQKLVKQRQAAAETIARTQYRTFLNSGLDGLSQAGTQVILWCQLHSSLLAYTYYQAPHVENVATGLANTAANGLASTTGITVKPSPESKVKPFRSLDAYSQVTQWSSMNELVKHAHELLHGLKQVDDESTPLVTLLGKLEGADSSWQHFTKTAAWVLLTKMTIDLKETTDAHERTQLSGLSKAVVENITDFGLPPYFSPYNTQGQPSDTAQSLGQLFKAFMLAVDNYLREPKKLTNNDKFSHSAINRQDRLFIQALEKAYTNLARVLHQISTIQAIHSNPNLINTYKSETDIRRPISLFDIFGDDANVNNISSSDPHLKSLDTMLHNVLQVILAVAVKMTDLGLYSDENPHIELLIALNGRKAEHAQEFESALKKRIDRECRRQDAVLATVQATGLPPQERFEYAANFPAAAAASGPAIVLSAPPPPPPRPSNMGGEPTMVALDEAAPAGNTAATRRRQPSIKLNTASSTAGQAAAAVPPPPSQPKADGTARRQPSIKLNTRFTADQDADAALEVDAAVGHAGDVPPPPSASGPQTPGAAAAALEVATAASAGQDGDMQPPSSSQPRPLIPSKQNIFKTFAANPALPQQIDSETGRRKSQFSMALESALKPDLTPEQLEERKIRKAEIEAKRAAKAPRKKQSALSAAVDGAMKRRAGMEGSSSDTDRSSNKFSDSDSDSDSKSEFAAITSSSAAVFQHSPQQADADANPSQKAGPSGGQG